VQAEVWSAASPTSAESFRKISDAKIGIKSPILQKKSSLRSAACFIFVRSQSQKLMKISLLKLVLIGFALVLLDIVRSAAATPPTITRQPFDKSATVGEKCVFQVTATGTPPLNYQWRLNGVDINADNAHSAKYTTPPAAPENDGNVYSVVVSNSAGSVTSVDAVMTVPPSEVFGTAADGSVLHWDVYTPEGIGPWPAFINIHGGGFVAGSPTSNQEGVTICKDLQASGYIVFAVTYRLAPPGHLPDQTSRGLAGRGQHHDHRPALIGR